MDTVSEICNHHPRATSTADYPALDRQGCGFAIRFIKALMSSDVIRDIGAEATLLCVFIVSREDRLHYTKPPAFWRQELLEQFGRRSPKDLVRIRAKAIDAGLLHYVEGARGQPGVYWVLVPEWMEAKMQSVPKRERKAKPSVPKRERNQEQSEGFRSQTGTDLGTDSGTDSGTHSITLYPTPNTPKKEKRARFVPPTIEQVTAYCHERNNAVDPQRFIDHYESNGWQVGKSAMRDWMATVRKWERNGFDVAMSPAKRRTANTGPGVTYDASRNYANVNF